MKIQTQLLRSAFWRGLRDRRGYLTNTPTDLKRSLGRDGTAEWLVVIPDHVGVLEKRMGVRKQHLEALFPRFDQGFWRLGGAILRDVQRPGESLDICGSVMIARAESREDVVKALRQDIYCSQGIWDLEKVQIHPVRDVMWYVSVKVLSLFQFKTAIQQGSKLD
ncbi:MAG: hypothetical protein Q9170_003357 [Blastenia crenularia]